MQSTTTSGYMTMAKTKFKWQENEYVPYTLMKFEEKDLRKEYSRLRSIYRKRYERLQNSEFAKSQTVRHYGKLPPIKQIKDKRQLVAALIEAERFLQKDISITTLRKRKKGALNTLQEHGYTFVNSENYDSFIDFMETFRTVVQGAFYDSEQIAEMYNDSVIKRKIDPADLQDMFEDFVESQRRAPGKKKFVGKKQVISSADLEEWYKNLSR